MHITSCSAIRDKCDVFLTCDEATILNRAGNRVAFAPIQLMKPSDLSYSSRVMGYLLARTMAAL